MNEQVELSAVQERRSATVTFYGYARQKRIPDGYMSEDRNMTTDEYPCAAVRPSRAVVGNEAEASGETAALRYNPFSPRRIVDALAVDGVIAYLTDSADEGSGAETVHLLPHVFYKNKKWELSGADSTNAGRLLAFGNGLFCVETGQYIPNRAKAAVKAVAVSSTASFTASYVDASARPIAPMGTTAPDSPSEGDRYYDTAAKKVKTYTSNAWVSSDPEENDYYYNADTNGLYIYTSSGWIPVPTYSTLLVTTDLTQMTALESIRKDDVLEMTEGTGPLADRQYVRVNDIGFSHTVAGDTFTAFEARITVGAKLTPGTHTLTLARLYPNLLHAVVSGNRVCGCVYDIDGAETVNEIRISRLGDPLNWYSYQGLEEDAFACTIGEPGEWTGAAKLSGNPVFFKERCLVTVYGDSPSGYSVVTTVTDGVKKGSDRSIAEINGALYYHSERGIMRLYAGAYPQCISDALKRKNVWEDAVAGTDGRKYYVEMTDLSDYDSEVQRYRRKLYVYDTELGVWHIEDAAPYGTVCFQRMGSDLLAVGNGNDGGFNTVEMTYLSAPEWDSTETFYTYLAMKQEDLTLLAPWDTGYPESVSKYVRQAGAPEWVFATGDYGHVGATKKGADPSDYKRVKEIDIRYWKETGAAMSVWIQYDQDGRWIPVTTSVVNGAEGTSRMRYRLKRCEMYRLKFAGTGRVCVYSITQTYEEAGDRSGD